MPITPEQYKALPIAERDNACRKRNAVQRIIDRQRGSLNEAAWFEARELYVSVSTVKRWLSNYNRIGFSGLIDARRIPKAIRSSTRAQS